MVIAKLLTLHFIADFILQPREMGNKKSVDLRWLAGHLAIQFVIFFPFTSIWFALANCAVHGVIDWFIWRGYKWTAHYRIIDKVAGSNTPDEDYQETVKSWKFWEDHLFYTTIGLDQLLHGLTLVFLAGAML